MARDLNDPYAELDKIMFRIRALEKATPLASASVGQGRLRMYDGGELLIEDGNLNVTGTATVGGTLDVTGTENVTGTMNVSGVENVTGTLNVDGNLNVSGTAQVTDGGTLRVGSMVLDPNIGSGAIAFDNGAQVFTSGDSIQIVGPGQSFVVQVESDQAWIGSAGRNFRVTGDGRYLSLLPTTTATTGLWQVVVDADGKLYRKAI